jgi:hypothetical protein
MLVNLGSLGSSVSVWLEQFVHTDWQSLTREKSVSEEIKLCDQEIRAYRY